MNDTSTPNWISRLCEDVQNGQFSTNLTEERFNDVLKWLLGREFIIGEQISRAMDKAYNHEDKARKNTFLALDDYLFVYTDDSPYAQLGLRSNANLATVKTRYRRLIQLYHPDRELAAANGLSNRAEKINRAYDRIKAGDYRAPQPASTAYRNTPRPPISDHPGDDNAVYRARAADQLRWTLGSSQKLTVLLISGLVIAAAALLFTVYNNNRPIDYPIPDELIAADSAEPPMQVQPSIEAELSTEVEQPMEVERPTEAERPIVVEPLIKTEPSKLAAPKIAGYSEINPSPLSGPDAPPSEYVSRMLTQAVEDATPADQPLKPEKRVAGSPPPAATVVKQRSVPLIPEFDQDVQPVTQTKATATQKAPATYPVAKKSVESAQVAEAALRLVPTRPAETTERSSAVPPIKTTAPASALPKTTQPQKAVVQASKPAPKPVPKPKAAPKPNLASSTQKKTTKPRFVRIPVKDAAVTEIQHEMEQNKRIADTLEGQPGTLETKEAPPPLPQAIYIKELSAMDRKQGINVLKGYVNGMLEGDVDQTLLYVDNSVRIDNMQTSKSQLRQTYRNWMEDATKREYKVKVSRVYAHEGLVRIKGKVTITFNHDNQDMLNYKGVLYYDVQLTTSGAKIVAITSG